MSEATVECPAEEDMLSGLEKLPKEKNPKVAKKRQANGKTPGAKRKSPAVAKSKQKLKVLVSKEATDLKPKPPVEKNMITPTLTLPAGEETSKPSPKKTSKPSPRLPVTKKCKKNLATAGRKTQKTNTGIKVNEVGQTKTPMNFVVCFFDELLSLKDPDVKKVIDLLFKADDVKVHRQFFVSCKNKAAAKKLQSELRDYDSYKKKFHILSNNPSFGSETQKNNPHMLYVVPLPRNTTDKDLQNSFTKAKSVFITTFRRGKKLVRMGHICFDSSIDAKDALAIKNRRIGGKYIQVTARKSAAMKRPFAQNVSSLPSKKAKLFMDKKTEDDADDHDNMLSNDQEDCGEDGESHDSDVNEKKEEDDESQNYEDGNRNDEEVDLDNET